MCGAIDPPRENYSTFPDEESTCTENWYSDRKSIVSGEPPNAVTHLVFHGTATAPLKQQQHRKIIPNDPWSLKAMMRYLRGGCLHDDVDG